MYPKFASLDLFCDILPIAVLLTTPFSNGSVSLGFTTAFVFPVFLLFTCLQQYVALVLRRPGLSISPFLSLCLLHCTVQVSE